MATQFDPGTVHLNIRWEDGRARDVKACSLRPDVATALRGREADAAVRILPLLYSICGAAQGLAARLALAAARGAPADESLDEEVLAEARREHLWRLLLDWPQALGLAPQEALFAEGRRRLAHSDFADWARTALRKPLAAVERTLQRLPAPAQAPARLLPPLTAAETLASWPRLETGFCAAPTWQGAAAETGALARHGEIPDASPFPARIRARVADILVPGTLGRASAATVAPGIGRAAVETARGLLLHEIALDGERVADYRIVAPTEWNFHPAGMSRAWLEGAAAPTPEAMRALAARAVLALDPCVRAQIEIDGDDQASSNTGSRRPVRRPA